MSSTIPMGKPAPKPIPQARLIAVSVVDAKEGMGVIKKVDAPKPKPRDREKTHVTNTAFRDSEALRELQRNLHRAENKKGQA